MVATAVMSFAHAHRVVCQVNITVIAFEDVRQVSTFFFGSRIGCFRVGFRGKGNLTED